MARPRMRDKVIRQPSRGSSDVRHSARQWKARTTAYSVREEDKGNRDVALTG